MLAVRKSEAQLQVDGAIVRADVCQRVGHNRVIGIVAAERDFLWSDVERDHGSVENNVIAVCHANQRAIMRIPDGPGSRQPRREEIWRLSAVNV